jgi:hypothetical protein
MMWGQIQTEPLPHFAKYVIALIRFMLEQRHCFDCYACPDSAAKTHGLNPSQLEPVVLMFWFAILVNCVIRATTSASWREVEAAETE